MQICNIFVERRFRSFVRPLTRADAGSLKVRGKEAISGDSHRSSASRRPRSILGEDNRGKV